MNWFGRWLFIFLGLAAWERSARAAAWIETTVTSDVVTVQVERDGRATVAHALALKIRGGPLKSWTLQGIDADAEPVADAFVVNAIADKTQSSRRELVMTRGDDESLQLDIVDDHGLRQGTYLLQFSYRTDFRNTKMMHARGPWLEIGWVGPRFPTGLDGAKVTFKLPAATTAPRLPEIDVSPDLPNIEGEPADSFVTTMRRSTEFDEIDLVRAHVALGEPVLWRLWASPAAFDATILPVAPVKISYGTADVAPNTSSSWGALGWLSIALLAAILWTSALLAKLRFHAFDCKEQGIAPRAILPIHPILRVTLSGLFVTLAVMLAWPWQAPTAATLCIVAAMLCAAQNSPKDDRSLRGPGVWLPLTGAEAFSRESTPLRGRFMDASRWQGLVLLSAGMLLSAVAMLFVSRHSPYDAALMGIMSPLPLPLFLTARYTQFPQARRQRAAAWLSRLHRRLTQARGHKAIAWARFPDGESAPDELRLRVVPPKSVDGFLGVEVAYQESAEHNDATACLMLRAKEGSTAQQIGRGQLVWQRGRRADEKVAIYPLDWPSCSLAEDIIVEMLGEFAFCNDSEVRKPSSRGKPVKASARGAAALKRGTGSLSPRANRRA